MSMSVKGSWNGIKINELVNSGLLKYTILPTSFLRHCLNCIVGITTQPTQFCPHFFPLQCPFIEWRSIERRRGGSFYLQYGLGQFLAHKKLRWCYKYIDDGKLDPWQPESHYVQGVPFGILVVQKLVQTYFDFISKLGKMHNSAIKFIFDKFQMKHSVPKFELHTYFS